MQETGNIEGAVATLWGAIRLACCSSPWATATSSTAELCCLPSRYLSLSYTHTHTHTQCNHIPNTTGFQSNLTHRNPLIKLICGDPHLPLRPQSNARPRTKTHGTLSLAAAQSAQMPASSQNLTPNYFPIPSRSSCCPSRGGSTTDSRPKGVGLTCYSDRTKVALC